MRMIRKKGTAIECFDKKQDHRKDKGIKASKQESSI